MWHAVHRFLRKVRRQVERERFRWELTEEISLHSDLKFREHLAAGVSEREALARARRDMGNITLAMEESTDVRRFSPLEHFMKDVRYALRQMMRQPAFSLVLILSLALGIGGNAAVFSTVNALLIKPLPFQDPDRLVRITQVWPKALLEHFQQRSRSLEIAAYNPGVELNLKTEDRPAFRILASGTSANLFSLLGARAFLGRTFQPGDDQPGRDPVALLSYDLWRSKFGSDPKIAGRIVRVNEMPRRIVGVLPAGFVFPSARVQLWFPTVIDPRDMETYWAGEFIPMIGRLRSGSTMEQAADEVRSLAATVWTMFPFPMPRGWNSESTVMPLQRDLAGDARSRILLLLWAVGAVLVIACTNVASLLLARAVTRRKEIALRAALGAGQARILRQLLTESVVLALIAGVAGLTLGAFALQLLRTVVPADLPGASRIEIDWVVSAYVASLSLLCGLAFGLAPALTASRLSLIESVKSSSEGRTASKGLIHFRDWLVGAEIALTLVLLIGATLLIRSLHSLSNVDPGFEAAKLMAVKISPDPSFCAKPPACIAFYDRIMDRARGLPDVIDVGAASTIPLDGTAPALAMDIEDHPKTAEHPAPMFWAGAVSPGYLRLTGIPLLAGRHLRASDSRDSEPVVVITASTAARFWPGEDPIGKRVKVVWETRWRTVVGVAADVRQYNLHNQTPAGIQGAMYMPYSQAVQQDRSIPAVMNVIVKAARMSPALPGQLHRLAVDQNPDIPAGDVVAMADLAGDSVSSFRATTWLFMSFAAVALVLAAVGIYGLVSYSVAQRSFEICIRMAMGSTRDRVLRMILGRSLRVASAGVIAGLAVALAMSRGLSVLLYGVAPTDPLVYASAAAFLFVVTALASLIPALRVLRIDPIRILRAD